MKRFFLVNALPAIFAWGVIYYLTARFLPWSYAAIAAAFTNSSIWSYMRYRYPKPTNAKSHQVPSG